MISIITAISLLPIERKWSEEKRLEYDAFLRH